MNAFREINSFKLPISLFLTICFISTGITYGDSNDITISADLSTYEFDTDQSYVIQTGGIAGVNETYPIEGYFQLFVDFNEAVASFELVDANLLEPTGFLHTESLNELFNMTELTGIVYNDTVIVFWGEVSDDPETNVLITVILSDDSAYIYGKTIPPACCDFFYFDMDAVATKKYSGGTGEPNNPYQIASANDLITLGETPEDYNKQFILTNNIDLSGYTFESALIAPGINIVAHIYGQAVLQFHGTKFTGVFDGDGYVITNFTINDDGAGNEYLGLFGCISNENSIIKNIGLENVSIMGSDDSDYIGSLCARNDGGSINNCYSTGSISTGDNSAKHIGGLCGGNYGSLSNSYSTVEATVGDSSWYISGLCGGNYGCIINCYSAGTVFTGDSSWYIGGLCGENDFGGSIINCYSTGSVTVGGSSMFVGGLCGENFTGSIINCYSAGTVITGINSEFIGGLSGVNVGGSICNSYYLDTAGPDNGFGIPLTDNQMKQQNSFVSWDFTGEIVNGTSDFWILPSEGLSYPVLTYFQNDFVPYIYTGQGTSQDPYQIYDANDLGAIWQNPDSYYQLQNNIDFNGIHWSSAIIPTFGGSFNGGGYVISNLNISGTGHLGLIGSIWDTKAQISDLGVENVILIGNDSSWSEVQNLPYWSQPIGEHSVRLGSLCGLNYGEINNCYWTGIVTGGDYYAGIIGGLCGLNYGNINNCYSAGNLSSGDNSRFAGGLCGENYGNIINCYSTGLLAGGYKGEALGGLCGVNSGIISNSYSTGDVSVGDDIAEVGGLCGMNDNGSISNCYSTGTVTGGIESSSFGGLCGYNRSGNIYNINGRFVENKAVENKGSISNCYSVGAVITGVNSQRGTRSSRGTGGLCGGNQSGSISNCYSACTVSAGYNSSGTGGFCGYNSKGSISNCYSVGTVSAGDNSEYVGGFCGVNLYDCNTINCYYLDTAGPDNEIGTPLTDNQMKQQVNFINWDFIGETDNGIDDIWWIDEGNDYPRLWWE